MASNITPAILGRRIRQLRIRRNLTQQDLAADDYSKSYISAIEQGKTRPSLEALQRIASRLQIPASTLLDPNAADLQVPDSPDAPKRVRRRRGASQVPGFENDSAAIDWQLGRAAYLIYTESSVEALEVLRPLLPGEEADSQHSLDAGQRLTALYLAGLASVHLDNTEHAVSYLQLGVQDAERLADREMAERLRNLLGTAYFRAGQYLIALEHHGRAAEAADAGAITDANLKLLVYSNLAADFWALQSRERALSAYRSAIEFARGLDSFPRQAEVFWARATQSPADWQPWQRRYSQHSQEASKTLGVYEALDNIREVAMSECSFGRALLENGDLDEAEAHLREGLRISESLNLGLDEAELLASMARLHMQRDNLEEARRYSDKAIELAREAISNRPDAQANSNGSTAAARLPDNALEVMSNALALGGEVSARSGDIEGAEALFAEAIKLIESAPGTRMAGDIYQRYAQSLSSRGHHEEASRFYERAYTARTRRA
ncbi:MAG TPA: helix-turn-helix domain-containing protein [Chloroflexia bacterium]|jgi:transcriptional regulator with XRE-family HTH domain